MNEANIEYRVRGPINTQLQLNRHCKQIVIAAQLISAKNFEKRADRMLHLSYVNLAEPRGPLGLLPDMSSARKEGHLMWPSSCAGLSEIASKCPSGPLGSAPERY